MDRKKFSIKADKRVLKAQSLMGPRSGPPTVVDSDETGKITRIRPFYYDEKYEWESLNPWKIEARGKTFEPPRRTVTAPYYLTYKKRVYSENRVRYPLKRVDWDPEGERNPQNRGKSKYVRISWDEATTIIAKELLRVREKYGPECVLSEADMHGEGKHVAPCHGCANRLLSLLGGYTTQMRNEDSWEGWYWGAKNVWGGEPVGQMQPSYNLWPDIAKHSDMLLFWGADPEVTPAGFDGMMASRLSQWLHALGLKFVYIDPALNYSGCYLADKWIPVYPNTDAALQLAIAHVWLTEGLYDKEYVESHAVGYEKFFDYVLGKVDGVSKTPAWASEKCGVPEWTIKAFARDWASKTVSITHGNGGPGIRGPFASEPGRLEPILLGMRGLGKPGVHQVKWIEWNLFTDKFPMPYQGKAIPTLAHFGESVRPPKAEKAFPHYKLEEFQSVAEREKGRFKLSNFAQTIEELAEVCRTMEQAPQQSIPKCMVHDAILNGKVDWWGLYSFCGPVEEQWQQFHFPAEGCSKIHMIWTDSPCMVTCWNDGFRFVKALRSPEIEFVLAQHPWLENDCYLADIILPVQTKFEMEDICDDPGGGVFTSVFHERPACPPVGESLNDFDCVAEVAKKISREAYLKYTAGEITASMCIDLFWQGSGVSHLDENDDFHKRDIFVLPCDPDIQKKVPPQLRKFAEDPENNPLQTPTGKLEFTSTGLLKHFPDDPERPPYPKWIERGPSHDETLRSERAKKYPLLCMSNHGRWRFHANLDDITWHREIETMKIRGWDGYQYEPVWMNTATAREYGVSHGDIVKLYNERGAVLGAAYVTERIIPGVVYMDHGSRFDPIDPEKLDRGGAINLISPTATISKNVTGMAVSGFLVGMSPVTDEEMERWKREYPEAFARKVDDACGVCLDGWLIAEKKEG